MIIHAVGNMKALHALSCVQVNPLYSCTLDGGLKLELKLNSGRT